MKYSFASILSPSALIVKLLSVTLQQYRHRIGICTSVPLLFVIGATSTCMAQIGNGPPVNNFQPLQGQNQSEYELDTGVTCPTPSFSIVGFSGNASDYVRPSMLDNSSNSGLDNYGIAAGITIPLGGTLADYCSDFAALRTSDLLKRIEIIESRFQSQLVKQCYYLLTLQIDFNNEYYNEDGPGAALFPCRAIVKSIQSIPQPSEVPQSLQESEDVISEPEPLTPRPTITYPTRGSQRDRN